MNTPTPRAAAIRALIPAFTQSVAQSGEACVKVKETVYVSQHDKPSLQAMKEFYAALEQTIQIWEAVCGLLSVENFESCAFLLPEQYQAPLLAWDRQLSVYEEYAKKSFLGEAWLVLPFHLKAALDSFQKSNN